MKLGKRIVKWLNEREFICKALKGKPFLGDKAYDSIKFIELTLLARLKLHIKLKKTWGKGINSEIRFKCKDFLESYETYRFRGLVDSIFGEIKQDVGSYERIRSFHIVQLFVLVKFILFNIGVLFFVWMIFQTLPSEYFYNFGIKTTFLLAGTSINSPVLGFLIFLSFNSLNSKAPNP